MGILEKIKGSFSGAVINAIGVIGSLLVFGPKVGSEIIKKHFSPETKSRSNEDTGSTPELPFEKTQEPPVNKKPDEKQETPERKSAPLTQASATQPFGQSTSQTR